MDCDLIKELRQNGVDKAFLELLKEILGCKEDGDLEIKGDLEIEGDLGDLEQDEDESSPDSNLDSETSSEWQKTSLGLQTTSSGLQTTSPNLNTESKAGPTLSPDLNTESDLDLIRLGDSVNSSSNLNYYLDRIETLQAKFSIKPWDEHFWFNLISRNDLKFLQDFYYFQIPNVIKQLKHLLDVYKILKDQLWYESTNSTSFIKILNNRTWTWIDVEDVDKEISQLYKQVLRLIFGYGKQLTPQQYPLYFFKSFKFRKEILKSKDFYKYFFTKNPAILNIPSFSLNHPKMQTIKFYLNQLYWDLLNESSKKKIKLLLLLLKDVKSYNHRNISLQWNYRKIFNLILKIFEHKINLLKILIDKSSDLYELYLFYKRFGWLEELRMKIKRFNKNVEKISKYFYKIKQACSLAPTSNQYVELLNKLKNGWNIWWIYLKKLSTFKNIENFYKLTKKNIKRRCKSTEEKAKKCIEKILNFDFLNELKEDFSTNKYFNWTIRLTKFEKCREIICNVKYCENYRNIDIKSVDIKPDYIIKLSFGWNFWTTKSEEQTYPQLLSDKIWDFIRKNSNELFANIIKTSWKQKDWLTPDFIIRIRDKKDKYWDHSQAIGSIILDSKFSKYSAFFGTCKDFDVVDMPLLKYYEELRKYFSYEWWDKRWTLKIIILYPWDKKIERKIKSINVLYQRATNVIACPISLYDENVINNQLDYLEKNLKQFIREILFANKTFRR